MDAFAALGYRESARLKASEVELLDLIGECYEHFDRITSRLRLQVNMERSRKYNNNPDEEVSREKNE